jgi:hypothetical protein
MMHEEGHQGPLLHRNMLILPRWQEVAVSRTVVFVPVCFAGIVVGTLFRDSSQPDVDFGSNIAGVILGGLCESLSFVIGFGLPADSRCGFLPAFGCLVEALSWVLTVAA